MCQVYRLLREVPVTQGGVMGRGVVDALVSRPGGLGVVVLTTGVKACVAYSICLSWLDIARGDRTCAWWATEGAK